MDRSGFIHGIKCAALAVMLLVCAGCLGQGGAALGESGDDAASGGAYSDERVRRIVEGVDIDAVPSAEPTVDDYPLLSVVPPGQKMPRWEVMKLLDVDPATLTDGIAWLKGRDVVVAYHLSPAYDLVYRSDFVIDDRPFDHENRMIHGVRIVPHRAYLHAEAEPLDPLYRRIYGLPAEQ